MLINLECRIIWTRFLVLASFNFGTMLIMNIPKASYANELNKDAKETHILSKACSQARFFYDFR